MSKLQQRCSQVVRRPPPQTKTPTPASLPTKQASTAHLQPLDRYLDRSTLIRSTTSGNTSTPTMTITHSRWTTSKAGATTRSTRGRLWRMLNRIGMIIAIGKSLWPTRSSVRCLQRMIRSGKAIWGRAWSGGHRDRSLLGRIGWYLDLSSGW